MISSVESARIGEMVDLLTSPHAPLPEHSDFTVVCGRKSEDLVTAARATASISDITFVTGKIGKDSGDLSSRGLTEAAFLVNGLQGTSTRILEDHTARTGIQNAERAVEAMQELGLDVTQALAVAHPAQLLRLSGLLRYEMDKAGLGTARLAAHRTGYPLLALQNPFDTFEVVSEIDLLDRYATAAHPRLTISDMPSAEMVAYARKVKANLQSWMKERGIRNPSTADNTNRAISPERMMLFATPGVKGISRGRAIVANVIELARAKRQVAAATRR